MADDAKIAAEIESLIAVVAREQFADAVIDSVQVVADNDSDNQPIWRVIVVFDDANQLDPRRTSGFVRHIRPKLMERAELWRFPLVRFMTKADARKLAAA